MPGFKVFGVTLGAHTLLVASMAFLLGFQLLIFAVLTKSFGIGERFLPPDPFLDRVFKFVNLEKGLIAGGLSTACGVALLLAAVNQWRIVDFGPLNYAHTMRWVIPGITLMTFGFQTIFSGFMISILGLRRK